MIDGISHVAGNCVRNSQLMEVGSWENQLSMMDFFTHFLQQNVDDSAGIDADFTSYYIMDYVYTEDDSQLGRIIHIPIWIQ